MALRRTARNLSNITGLWMTQTYVPLASRRKPVATFVVEHKNGNVHRSTASCPLCQEAAKKAAPQFSSVDDVFVRHGGNDSY